MIATSHPDTMTVEERRQEIARLLATGLVRCVQQARTAVSSEGASSGGGGTSPLPPSGLDVPAKLRLSVSR
jgi:hypothetical protein